MALALKDVRLTIRRGRGVVTGLAIYPRLLRDRSVLPRIDICIQYLETMLGRERQDLDLEVLAHFLGDYKLARGLLACLGSAYRFVSPSLAQAVPEQAWTRLQQLNITTPMGLRLWLYDQLNERGFGYLGAAERTALPAFEAQLAVAAGSLERLLVLDAEEHAVIHRVGPRPAAVDVMAHFNHATLEGLLRHAMRAELTFRSSAQVAPLVRALCLDADVDAVLSGHGADLTVCLEGRQDALGVWSRHGRRLARLLVSLVQRGGGLAMQGSAAIALRGREGELRLNDEALHALAGQPPANREWDTATGWDAAFTSDLASNLRAAGWRVARQPEARVSTAGVLLPDLAIQHGGQAWLVVNVRSALHAEYLGNLLPRLAQTEPLALVGDAPSLAPLAATAGPRLAAVVANEPKSAAAGLALLRGERR